MRYNYRNAENLKRRAFISKNTWKQFKDQVFIKTNFLSLIAQINSKDMKLTRSYDRDRFFDELSIFLFKQARIIIQILNMKFSNQQAKIVSQSNLECFKIKSRTQRRKTKFWYSANNSNRKTKTSTKIVQIITW